MNVMQTSSSARMTEPLLVEREVAELLRMSPRSIARLVAAGHLPRVKIGRSVRFRPADVSALIQSGLRAQPAAKDA